MKKRNKEYEIIFTRHVLCAIVQQAVRDAQGESKYNRKYTNRLAKIHRDEAIHFLKSRAFEGICNALNVPIDRIRRAAYT